MVCMTGLWFEGGEVVMGRPRRLIRPLVFRHESPDPLQ